MATGVGFSSGGSEGSIPVVGEVMTGLVGSVVFPLGGGRG